MIEHIANTPLGWFRAIGTEQHLVAAGWINEEDAIVGSAAGRAAWRSDLETQLKEYFYGNRNGFALPIDPQGSTFQKSIWDTLMNLPSGKRHEISSLQPVIDTNTSSQAILQAVLSNPCLLLIPCHRIDVPDIERFVYGGGSERKEWLVRHEGLDSAQQLNLFE